MTRQSNAWFVKTGLIICICLLTAANSQAVSLIWDPTFTVGVSGGGAGTWDTVTPLLNWYNAAVPGDVAWIAGSDAVFGAPTGGTGGAVTVSSGGAGVSVESLTFSANNYSIGGDKLILTGTPVITTTNNATINSVIDGAIGFSKAGGGVLTLAAATGNTYAGATTITAGTLSYSNTNQLGNGSATNRIVFNGGGTLSPTAPMTEARGIDMTTAGTLNPGANAITLSGDLEGTGALTLGGPGPVTLANTSGTASTFSGIINLVTLQARVLYRQASTPQAC